MKKRIWTFVTVLFSALLCSCSGQQNMAPSQTTALPTAEHEENKPAYDRLTIYSPLPEQETLLYCSAFHKDTGINVDCIYLPVGEMAKRLEQEKENPQAAVLLGGAADNYIQLSNAGLLEPYQSPELTDVPENYLDKQGVWNPIYIGTLCFACNRDWFTQQGEPLPVCWDDLLSPALQGRIAVPNPMTSGTTYTTIATLVQMRGEAKAWEYLRQFDRNVGKYTASSTEAVDCIRDGAYAMTIVFYHDGRRAVLDGDAIELVNPSDGTGYEIGACALIRNSPEQEKENARRFIDWMTSARGEECYIEARSCRLPANQAARAADGLSSLEDMKLINYDIQWAGTNRDRLVKQFSEIRSLENDAQG